MFNRMLRTTLSILLVIALTTGISLQPTMHAQVNGRRETKREPPRRDERVEEALDQLGLVYTTLEAPASGYQVRFGIEGTKRHQFCGIMSFTERYHGLEVREVISHVMIVRGQLPARTADRLLRYNSKFGGWRLIQIGKGEAMLYFAAQIAADADPATLRAVMNLAVVAADGMEAEFAGVDIY